jgi:flagellin
MDFRINTNLASSNSILGVNKNLTSLYKSLEKLASGRRINSAADDPAGLVISQQLQSQIGGLNQEIENLNANIHKYESVSGTVMQMREQLTEMRSLAIGAANAGFNSEAAQQAYDSAAQSVASTYNLTAASAQYNGANTLDGSEGSLAAVTELTGIDLSNPEAAVSSLEEIDRAIAQLDEITVELGSTQKYDLEGRLSSLEIQRQNLTAAESSIGDTDYASEISNMIRSLIGTKASMAVLSHSFLSAQTVIGMLDM